MDPFDPSAEIYDDGTPNLPVVAVRGVQDKDVWRCYERYRIQFTPPTENERKLCEVIVALEELVGDQETTIARLRQRPQA